MRPEIRDRLVVTSVDSRCRVRDGVRRQDARIATPIAIGAMGQTQTDASA